MRRWLGCAPPCNWLKLAVTQFARPFAQTALAACCQLCETACTCCNVLFYLSLHLSHSNTLPLARVAGVSFLLCYFSNTAFPTSHSFHCPSSFKNNLNDAPIFAFQKPWVWHSQPLVGCLGWHCTWHWKCSVMPHWYAIACLPQCVSQHQSRKVKQAIICTCQVVTQSVLMFARKLSMHVNPWWQISANLFSVTSSSKPGCICFIWCFGHAYFYLQYLWVV